MTDTTKDIIAAVRDWQDAATPIDPRAPKSEKRRAAEAYAVAAERLRALRLPEEPR